MFLADILRDVLRCLADDLEISKYSIDGLLVGDKLLVIHICGISLDLVDSFQNIVEMVEYLGHT